MREHYQSPKAQMGRQGCASLGYADNRDCREVQL